ncbi:MAG: hypothetical protein JWM32_1288 [Verrucomicrobia bacterium]|nr:hypothetical protein [Verrucomicrobiota bacterium]
MVHLMSAVELSESIETGVNIIFTSGTRVAALIALVVTLIVSGQKLAELLTLKKVYV